MRLRDFISDDAVRLDLAGTSKDDVLEELARLIHADDRATATLLRILRRREHLGSTGVGRGIAIPHCRTLVANRLRVAFARHDAGVEWDAIDRRPVHYLFLIVAPPLEVSNQYLPVLGKIAQFVKDEDVPKRLMQIQEPQELLALIEEKGV
jgi:mannitol/fructose-specific phosphotransferase system IIA component (Ntr-type)